MAPASKLHVAAGDEVGGRREVVVAERPRAVLGVERQAFGRGGDQQVAGDQHVGAGGRHAAADHGLLGLADLDVAEHRPALLGQARHVDDAGGAAVDVGGHGQDRGHGGHPRAADAGEQDLAHAVSGSNSGSGVESAVRAAGAFLAWAFSAPSG
jgi:hypothetical protein